MTFLIPVLLAAMCADETASAKETPQRLSLDAATAKVVDHVRQKKPRAQLQGLAVTELTTEAVWDRLHVQIVKVTEGAVEQGETFVLHGDKVFPIGRAVGGDGITSALVADLVGDKHPVLVYAFAWGSGEHRSEVGVLDFHGKVPTELRLAPVNFSFQDYIVRDAGDNKVEVLMEKTVIGRVSAIRTKDLLSATINVEKELPAELQRQLR